LVIYLGIALLLSIVGGGVYLIYKVDRLEKEISAQARSEARGESDEAR